MTFLSKTPPPITPRYEIVSHEMMDGIGRQRIAVDREEDVLDACQESYSINVSGR